MAIGRAVITTDVPGCRDTVVEGVNGFIVQRWSAKDLVLSMDKFITKTELITLMGDESYNLALENFDANKTNEKIINILC